MNRSRLGLSFSMRTRLIGFESISSLSKAIERIFERQARSRLTLAGVRGLGRSSLSCLVGVAPALLNVYRSLLKYAPVQMPATAKEVVKGPGNRTNTEIPF
jgi:hypothetical protein